MINKGFTDHVIISSYQNPSVHFLITLQNMKKMYLIDSIMTNIRVIIFYRISLEMNVYCIIY